MVTRNVILDAGPLSVIAHPKATPAALAGRAWMERMAAAGVLLYVPEIADYEVRRELIRAKKTTSLRWLDWIIEQTIYLPLSTATMRHAAQLWASARNSGLPTASNDSIDGDVILCAQALTLGATDCIIATTNPGHISRFYPTAAWNDLTQP